MIMWEPTDSEILVWAETFPQLLTSLWSNFFLQPWGSAGTQRQKERE